MLTVATFKEKQDDWKLLAKVVDPKKILSEETLFLYLAKNKIRKGTDDENYASVGYSIHEALKDENHPTNKISDLDFGLGRTIKLCDNITFELIDPCIKNQTSALFIIARKGAGKSYFIGKYLEKYNDLFPSQKIYMISRKTDDPAFDKVKNLKYIDIEDDTKYGNNPLTYLDLPKDCILVCDDSTCYKEKRHQNMVNNLRNDVLQLGRSRNIALISSSHLYNNYKETSLCWLESSWLIVSSLSQIPQAKRAIVERIGYNKKIVNKIWPKLESRLFCFHNESPDLVISEHECHMFEGLEE